MNTDEYGQVHVTQDDLVTELYKNPAQNIFSFLLDDPVRFNNSNKILHAGYQPLQHYTNPNLNIDEFDKENQNNWFMPNEYKNIDIYQFVLDQCNGEAELQRAGQELLIYAERGLVDMLRYLKYLVDTFRKNGIVWGVGRGSSVASFVLFIIGVHKVNSLYYDLDIKEFLK